MFVFYQLLRHVLPVTTIIFRLFWLNWDSNQQGRTESNNNVFLQYDWYFDYIWCFSAMETARFWEKTLAFNWKLGSRQHFRLKSKDSPRTNQFFVSTRYIVPYQVNSYICLLFTALYRHLKLQCQTSDDDSAKSLQNNSREFTLIRKLANSSVFIRFLFF